MMIKKLNRQRLFFLILAVLTMGAIACSQNIQASANDNQWITSAELKDLTNPNATTNYDQHDSLRVDYTFKIPKGSLSASNNSFDAVLPSQFSMANGLTFNITDSSGAVVGTATADPSNNHVHVIMKDNAIAANANGDYSGNLFVACNWNMSVVPVNTPTTIYWNLPDSDHTKPGQIIVNINPDNGPGKDEKLAKFGWYDKDDPTLVDWTVRVNVAKEHIDNAVVTDQLAANQKLENTATHPFVALKVSYYADGSDRFTTLGNVSDKIVMDSDTKFHLNLGNIDDTYLIYYYSRLTDGGKTNEEYGNNIHVDGTNNYHQDLTVWTAKYAGGGNAGGGGNTPSNNNGGGNNNNGGNNTPANNNGGNTPSNNNVTPSADTPKSSNSTDGSSSNNTVKPSTKKSNAVLPATGATARPVLLTGLALTFVAATGAFVLTRKY
ncbi:LPXTG cell wall anchor domain-containing protein [Fructobacillus durionis]|uniref:Collagen binding domain-containing protein n=1 Tax=Fructobacillus durionis TaxID=283737 RepID=A0A1I1G7C6_9LACO|nr:LPXTG cell wall anchor domain-containing protein [Fructobacillus durionis]SFC05768.1 Collagen binding domain-containing protein [Fructobacillus durionis]